MDKVREAVAERVDPVRVAVAVDAVAVAVVLLLGVNEGLRVFVADAVKVDFVWVRVIVKVGVPVDRVGDTVADALAGRRRGQ